MRSLPRQRSEVGLLVSEERSGTGRKVGILEEKVPLAAHALQLMIIRLLSAASIPRFFDGPVPAIHPYIHQYPSVRFQLLFMTSRQGFNQSLVWCNVPPTSFFFIQMVGFLINFRAVKSLTGFNLKTTHWSWNYIPAIQNHTYFWVNNL